MMENVAGLSARSGTCKVSLCSPDRFRPITKVQTWQHAKPFSPSDGRRSMIVIGTHLPSNLAVSYGSWY